jgi:photosystem II stability/assembly factor-like uncharacterized protein
MNDPLQRLRAANPVPGDPGAPPIEHVRTRIAAGEPVPARRPRRRWSLGAAAPVLGAFAVAAVVAGVVLVIGVRSQPGSTPEPAGGMRGSVAPYASGLDGVTNWVWFSRCLGRCDGSSEHVSNWLATTTDGGRNWAVTRRPRIAMPPVSRSGHNDWAGSAGNREGGGVVVTHDGGGTWQAIQVPHSPNPYSVSVAGAEAWAVGSGCSGICGGAILRGPASGSQLEPTPTTPQHAGGALQLVALGADSAYLYTPFGAGRRTAWLTTDAGRSWLEIAPGCPSNTVSGSGTVAIWRSCRPSAGHSTIGISTDGGRHWSYRPASFSTGVLYPSSAQIAWAQTTTGATVRTTDGGRRWHTVWSPPPGEGRRVALSLQSATVATETRPVTHTEGGVQRTNLAVYRIADGGSNSVEMTVPLPSR